MSSKTFFRGGNFVPDILIGLPLSGGSLGDSASGGKSRFTPMLLAFRMESMTTEA